MIICAIDGLERPSSLPTFISATTNTFSLTDTSFFLEFFFAMTGRESSLMPENTSSISPFVGAGISSMGMSVRFSISFMSFLSSLITNDNAIPRLPALPVLPMRCT